MHATLTSKAQITLPKEVRQLLQLTPGDKVAFVAQADGQITVSKANSPSFAQLRGVLPKPSRALSIDEMNEAIVSAALERQRGR
jgi:antitoxin PrlF